MDYDEPIGFRQEEYDNGVLNEIEHRYSSEKTYDQIKTIVYGIPEEKFLKAFDYDLMDVYNDLKK